MARHQHENKGRKAEATPSKSEDHTGRPNHRQRTQREVEDIEERSTPPTPIIYEVIRKLGEEEMGRPVTSLCSASRTMRLGGILSIAVSDG